MINEMNVLLVYLLFFVIITNYYKGKVRPREPTVPWIYINLTK
jgi:hypothetical protein